MTYQPQNKYQHDCPTPSECLLCAHEDAAERAAIQTEGKPLGDYQRALALILERRRRGQRELGIT